MRRKIFGGTTSVSLPINVQDTSSTIGGGLSGLVFGTAGLVAEYRRHGQSTWTTIVLVTKTLGTWTSGGFIADGALAGAYELDPPDAALASGVRWVLIRLRGAANMLPVLIEIELDAVNYQSANGFITGINSLAPPANWNLMAIDGSGRMDLAKWIGMAPNVLQSGRVDSYIGAGAANVITGAMIADGAIDAATFAAGAIDSTAIATDAIGAAKVAAAAVTKIQTGLSTYAGGAVASVTAPVTAGTVTDKTGYALTSGERTAIANEVEAQIIDETDSEKVLTAITDKIASVNPSLGALTLSAIAAAVRDVILGTPAAGSLGDALLTAAATYGRIGATGSGLTSLAPASTALSNVQWTNSRASNLDFLDASVFTVTSVAIAIANRIPGVIQPQTGDAYARIGAAGAGLTAIGDARMANLDAAITTRLAPTTAGRTLDVSVGGEAGIDLANVGSPTATVTLSGTTISTGQAVASVAGAVGSVTGNVGGNLVGSIGSLSTQAKADVNAEADAALADVGLTATVTDRIDAIKTATDHLATTIELSGGSYRFTATALALAPTGSGGIVTGYATGEDPATILDARFDALDTAIGAVGAKTVNLPADPADASVIAGAFGTVNTTLAVIAGYIDTEVPAIKSRTDLIPNSPASVGSAMTLAPGSIGDATFTLPALSGPATGAVGMIVQLWRRFFKHAVRSSTQIITYANDGTTPVTTQTISDTAGVQDQGAAT